MKYFQFKVLLTLALDATEIFVCAPYCEVGVRVRDKVRFRVRVRVRVGE
jgi:hypothetical protein